MGAGSGGSQRAGRKHGSHSAARHTRSPPVAPSARAGRPIVPLRATSSASLNSMPSAEFVRVIGTAPSPEDHCRLIRAHIQRRGRRSVARDHALRPGDGHDCARSFGRLKFSRVLPVPRRCGVRSELAPVAATVGTAEVERIGLCRGRVMDGGMGANREMRSRRSTPRQCISLPGLRHRLNHAVQRVFFAESGRDVRRPFGPAIGGCPPGSTRS